MLFLEKVAFSGEKYHCNQENFDGLFIGNFISDAVFKD
jgi:hypothetical protein